jgi:hypothetical protein
MKEKNGKIIIHAGVGLFITICLLGQATFTYAEDDEEKKEKKEEKKATSTLQFTTSTLPIITSTSTATSTPIATTSPSSSTTTIPTTTPTTTPKVIGGTTPAPNSSPGPVDFPKLGEALFSNNYPGAALDEETTRSLKMFGFATGLVGLLLVGGKAFVTRFH